MKSCKGWFLSTVVGVSLLGLTGCAGQQHAADANGTEGQSTGPTHVGQGEKTGSANGHGAMSSAPAQEPGDAQKQK